MTDDMAMGDRNRNEREKKRLKEMPVEDELRLRMYSVVRSCMIHIRELTPDIRPYFLGALATELALREVAQKRLRAKRRQKAS